AQHFGGFDIVALADGERLGAGDTHAPGPGGEAQDDGDDQWARLADKGGQDQQQRQVGDDQHHNGAEVDDLVDDAALVAGDDPQNGADDGDEQAGAEPDGQRDAGPVDEAGKDVVAEPGSAQPVVP